MARFAKWLVALLAGTCAACAIITVNVYFPEKDVKQAYKSLDEMLLKEGEKAPPADKPVEKKDADKPVSLLPVSLIAEACASENVADDLAVELATMPEVLRAYDDMRSRLPKINALRDTGAVGETNQGLLTIRDKGKAAGQEGLVKAENDNRKTVVMGMAKAIMKINRQKSDKIPGHIIAKAAAMYADTKREAARPGWWVQGADGSWSRK